MRSCQRIVRLRTRLPDAGGVHDVSDIVVGSGHRRRRVAPGVGETFLGWLIPGARSGRPLQAFAPRAALGFCLSLSLT